jgi:hypothetical protein
MVERTAPEQPRRRGKGKPFVPGDSRINRDGRPPGRRAKLDAMLAKVGTSTPLETLLEIMHGAKDQATRLKAATAAAPYCHPRLSADIGPGLGNLDHQGDEPERFTLTIFDPHNRPHVQRVLPPPDGDEHQEDDNDPTT